MARLLRRIWAWPWPQWVRQMVLTIATVPVLRNLMFPRFMVGVVAIIENDAGEILLLRHTYRGTWPWGPPSGFVEHGEQPYDALHRELTEETGFVVELMPNPSVIANTDRPLVNIIYRGRYLGGAFTAGPEISEAAFFSFDSLPALVPGQEALLRSFHEVQHERIDGVRS